MPLDSTNFYPKGPVLAGDMKQFYDLATGVMLDQPVTYRNVLSVGGNQGLTTVPLKIYGATGQNTNLIDLYADRSAPQPGFGFNAAGAFAWGPGGAAPQDTFLSRIGTQVDATDRPGLLINPDLRVSSTLTVGVSISLPTSGAIIFGAANRLRGDLSNVTHAQRLLFLGTTSNTSSVIGIIPNGSGTASGFNSYNSSNPDLASYVQLGMSSTSATLISSHTGTAGDLPLVMGAGTTARLTIPTAGYATFAGVSVCVPNSSYYAAMDTGGVQRPMLWQDSLNNTVVQAGGANVTRFLNQPVSVEWARFDATHLTVNYQESIVYIPPAVSASSYLTAMLELRTNASVPPQLSFHMPGAIGGTMYMPVGGWPRWILNTSTDYAFVMDGLTQTLTSKTITSPTLNGTVAGQPGWASAQAFPASTTVGGRPIMLGYANASDYQVDYGITGMVTIPAGGAGNTAVSFNHAFSTPPAMVQVTLTSFSGAISNGLSKMGSPNVHGIGTNGFFVDLDNQTGGSQAVQFAWLAIGR